MRSCKFADVVYMMARDIECNLRFAVEQEPLNTSPRGTATSN